MLRISDGQSSGDRRVLKLEGSVSASCVSQVEVYCEQVLSDGVALTIDMSDVSFLDTSGVHLFSRLLSKRVQLHNCSPFVSELLKQIPLD